MPLTNSSDITLEKTPAYFISKTAPERVWKFDKNMRLLVVTRNPITRAISDYTQALSKRKKGSILPTFEKMVFSNETKDRKYGVNSSWGAIRIGIYHRFVKRWLQFFPLEQFHFVDGERLIINPASEIRIVEHFLGVKPTVQSSNFVTDPIKGFPCVLRLDNTMHCLGKTKGRAHPQVREDVLKKLRAFYAPENEKFFKLINNRFHW